MLKMAEGVPPSSVMTQVRSSSQIISATLGSHDPAKKYSKRGEAGGARKLDVFYLMQKYGAKRDFIKDAAGHTNMVSDEESVSSKPINAGFVIKFSLSGAYKALERQEFEASVPQITPVKVIRKRTILMKRATTLGAIPEGTIAAASTRGTPELSSKTLGGSVISASTNAKSKRAQALEQLKTRNQEKIFWKNLQKNSKAEKDSEKVLNRPLDTSDETNLSISKAELPSGKVQNSPKLLKRQSSKNLLFQRQTSSPKMNKEINEPIAESNDEFREFSNLSRENSRTEMYDLNDSGDLEKLLRPDMILDSKNKREKSKSPHRGKPAEKSKSESKDKKGTNKKTLKLDEKSEKVYKKSSKQNLLDDKSKNKCKNKKMDSKTRKLERESSKKDLSDDERPVSRRKGRKEPEIVEPTGSKLFRTMMKQTLGGKRPDDTEDDASMDTLARFLTANYSSTDEETVIASEKPGSRISSDLPASMNSVSGSVFISKHGEKRLSEVSAKEKAAYKDQKGAIPKDNPKSAKSRKSSAMSDEEKLQELRKRKVSKYLYHMCNCRYIARHETLSRLYKKKQNVAGVIEIYGCPPAEEKKDSSIVCPFCTVFPRERVFAWLEELGSDEEPPHNK